MPTLYGTLTQIRARLPQLTGTGDDSLLLDSLEDASRALDGATHRFFYPKIATRYYDYQEQAQLKLDEDLLSVTTLTTDNEATTIEAANYFPMCGDSYNLQPYDRIRLKADGASVFGYSGTSQRSQKVIGVWGCHDDYAGAHVASGDTVQNATQISSSGTTLQVTSGANFQRGQTLRIESEWLVVSAISGNNLTVERGQNGSTAATHAAGTAIDIYRPMRDVERVTLRFAVWLYKQLEAPFTFELQTDAGGRVIIPPNAPPEVHRFIKHRRRAL
jgi:hypothetical protein